MTCPSRFLLWPQSSNIHAGIRVKEIDSATLLAFGIAPVVPALPLAYLTQIMPGDPTIVSVFGFTIIGYFFACLPTAILGFPLYVLADRLNLVRWWSTLIGGAAIGLMVFLVIAPATSSDLASASFDRRAFSLYVALGALAGVIFFAVRAIARRSLGSE